MQRLSLAYVVVILLLCVCPQFGQGAPPHYEMRICDQPADVVCVGTDNRQHKIHFRTARAMPVLEAYDGEVELLLNLCVIDEIKFISTKPDASGRQKADIRLGGSPVSSPKGGAKSVQYDILTVRDKKPVYIEGKGDAGPMKIALQTCKLLTVYLLGGGM